MAPLMRELNERVAQAFEVEVTDAVEVVCECGDIGCFEVVPMTVAEYEALVAEGGAVLAARHRGGRPAQEGRATGGPLHFSRG
jgi:hypothetical protein